MTEAQARGRGRDRDVSMIETAAVAYAVMSSGEEAV
jgi:hypothetical protein